MNRKEKALQKLLIVLVIIQFGVIIFINLTKTKQMLGYDSSLAIRHAVEMWKNGLYLKDFQYFSTMEIDNVAFFAAPIYILTGKLNVSIAIMHIVFYIIIAGILYDICRNTQGKKINYLLAILLFFTPFSFGELEWANLIYLMVGQYEFRIIVLLLIIDTILMCSSNALKQIKFIALVCVTSIMTFWTSLSCGNYVLLMEIFPLIVYLFFYAIVIEDNKIVTRKNCAILCYIIFSLLGWKLHNHFAGVYFRNTLNYISASSFINNIFNEITGIFLLFGGLTYSENLAVLSLDGIEMAIHLLFIVVCIYLIITNIKSKKIQKSQFFWMFVAVAGINLAVLAVTNTQYGTPIFEYRYHIIWCVSMLLSISEMIDFLSKKRLVQVINTVFLLSIVLINVSNFKNIYKQTGYIDRDNQILSIAEECDTNSIYLYDMQIDAHVIRALNTDVYCVSTTVDDNNTINIDVGDFYYDYADNAMAESRNMLIIKEADYRRLPNYIKNSYTQIANVIIGREYSVYIAEKNPWDGKSGLPGENSEKSVDYPYSSGFSSIAGEIQDNGALIVKNEEDGYVLYGPYTITKKGTYNVRIYYEIADTIENAFCDVCINSGETELSRETINKNGITELKNVEIPEGETFEVRVWMPKDNEIQIEKIEYERIEN